MNWYEQRTRIQRMLRDPDSNIWNSSLLLRLFNDVQKEVQQKTNILEDVKAIRVPPLYYRSYLHDWEWSFAGSNEQNTYNALRCNQMTGRVFCYRWEAQTEQWLSGEAADDGDHFTQPWEAFMCDTHGDIVSIPFPTNFDKAKWVGWDKEPIDYIDLKNLMSDDNTWITHSGKPQKYWRNGTVDNDFVIYPLPSSPVWDDVESPSAFSETYVGTDSFEVSGDYIDGDGILLTTEGTSLNYVFQWEENYNTETESDIAQKSCFGFEVGKWEQIEDSGILFDLFGDDFSGGESGGIVDRTATLFSDQDYGVAIDAISFDDNIGLIYQCAPTDIQDTEDESEFPSFLQKYIEYGVLERAYAVNNDGKIESLRDYWQYRKNLGLKFIKRYMEKRMVDRDYRMLTRGIPGRRTRRQPRLPDTYPAAW